MMVNDGPGPAVRGNGVGRQVLHFALSEATVLGIKTLHLEAETDNESATRLYRSAGFRGDRSDIDAMPS